MPSLPTLLKSYHKAQQGFSLLELLVVLVIMGLLVGTVTMTSVRSDQQKVQQEAQRIALLLQMAREEAIVRNTAVAFRQINNGYQFEVLQDKKWVLIQDSDAMRAREFELPNTKLIYTLGSFGASATISNSIGNSSETLIVFGREPVGQTFQLHVQSGDYQSKIVADGIGHFIVD